MDLNAGSGSDGEAEGLDEVMDVQFTAVAVHEDDYQGIKVLLQQTLRRSGLDTAALADLLVKQPVTTVVKVLGEEEEEEEAAPDSKAKGKGKGKGKAKQQEKGEAGAHGGAAAAEAGGNDDDRFNLFAVASALNLQDHKEHKCVGKAMAWLTKMCPNKETKAKFAAAVAEPATSWLVHDRFINIPPQLSVPMLATLRKDLGPQYKKTKRFVMIFRGYQVWDEDADEDDDEEAGSKPRKRRRKDGDATLTHTEDDALLEFADVHFTFVMPADERDRGTGFKHYRTVAVIGRKALDEAISRLDELFGMPYEEAW